jgi:hypothetical protein
VVSRGLLLDYCLNGCVSDRRIAHVDPAVTNKLLSSLDLAGYSNIQWTVLMLLPCYQNAVTFDLIPLPFVTEYSYTKVSCYH